MKASDVYLRAAQLIYSRAEDYSCYAIHVASGADKSLQDSVIAPHRRRYTNTFGELGAGYSREEWLQMEGFSRCRAKRQMRGLALLFMRQIALDEERSGKP